MFLHGWGFDHRVFSDLIEKLQANYKVRAVSLPGYGDEKLKQDVSIRAQANVLAGKITEPVYLVAWSMGGLIAMTLADNFPEKIKGLVLLASTPSFTQRNNWPAAMEKKVLESFQNSFLQNPDQTLDKFKFLITQGDPDQLHLIKRVSKNTGTASNSVLESGLKLLLKTDQRKVLSELKLPFLMFFAENDHLVPATVAKEVVKLNPLIVSEMVLNAGHTFFLSQQTYTIEVIQKFINRIESHQHETG